ncbi:MAG: hypothetical protein RLZZ59_718 [Pseudomonadota bacterium]|jgi:Skp family chaperone for outer membrane proteins
MVLNLYIRSFLFLCLALCSFCSVGISGPLPKPQVAIVDVQAILDNSIAVKSLRQSIDEISEKLHSELSAKESELKATEIALNKKRDSISEDQFNKEVQEFYKQVSDVQRDMQSRKSKLEQAHADAVESVHVATIKIIDEISKDRAFNIVLPASQVLYFKKTLDITDEVLQKLNDRIKLIELKY